MGKNIVLVMLITFCLTACTVPTSDYQSEQTLSLPSSITQNSSSTLSSFSEQLSISSEANESSVSNKTLHENDSHQIIDSGINKDIWKLEHLLVVITLPKGWYDSGGGSLFNSEDTMKVWFGPLERLETGTTVRDILESSLARDIYPESIVDDGYYLIDIDGTKREVQFSISDLSVCYSYTYCVEIQKGICLTCFFYTYTGHYEPDAAHGLFMDAVASVEYYS